MGNLGLTFNAAAIEAERPMEALTPGWYTAMLEEAEVKITSAGTGKYIACTYKILAPEGAAGRVVFDNINHDNPNQTATEIGQRRLAAICNSIGVVQLEDTSVLLNKPMDIKLGMEKKTDEYPDPRNNIKGIRAASNVTGGAAAANPATANPAASTAPANPVASVPATPASPATPAAPESPAAPVTPAAPVYENVYVHTCTQFTKEQYQADPAWTEEVLVGQGKGRIDKVEVKPAAPASPATPASPAAPATPASPASSPADGISEKPPWMS